MNDTLPGHRALLDGSFEWLRDQHMQAALDSPPPTMAEVGLSAWIDALELRQMALARGMRPSPSRRQ